MSARCPGCGRPPATCWIMPCLVLEIALAAGPRAVLIWSKKAGCEIRPPSELRLRKDGGIDPDPNAPRVLTTRDGASWVTRDADRLFYVWSKNEHGTHWLFAWRRKTPAITKARQLARIEREKAAS